MACKRAPILKGRLLNHKFKGENKPTHYSYIIDHDKNFAPHAEGKYCTLSGCKKGYFIKKRFYRNIEELADNGSWVIGFGGNNTGEAGKGKLIYAMRVCDNCSYNEFKSNYRKLSSYLPRKKAGFRVLVSNHYYYFGRNAIKVEDFKELKKRGPKYKRLKTKKQVEGLNKLISYLKQNYKMGIQGDGKPCNKEYKPDVRDCRKGQKIHNKYCK